MTFISEEQRERSAAFDKLVEITSTALVRPDVLAALGSRATKLRDEVQTLFLPNVSRGLVSIPRPYRRTGHAALLPVLESDKLLQADFSAAQPTPHEIARFSRIDRLRLRHEFRLFKSGEPLHSRTDQREAQYRAPAQRVQWASTVGGIEVATRPIIKTAADLLSEPDATVGAALAHELHHIVTAKEAGNLAVDGAYIAARTVEESTGFGIVDVVLEDRDSGRALELATVIDAMKQAAVDDKQSGDLATLVATETMQDWFVDNGVLHLPNHPIHSSLLED